MLQRIFLVGLASLCRVLPSQAQVSQSDSLLLASMQHSAVDQYQALIGSNQHIFRGPQFVPFLGQEDKNPFYASSDWEDSNVRYDDQWYRVPVLYNTVQDEVAVLLPNGNSAKLEKGRVSSFDLHGARFVNKLDNALKEKGFYQVLYEGNIQVLARRKKQYMERVTYDGAYYEYLNRDYYLVYKNGTYFSVKGKHSVLKIFDDHKKELRKLLSERHISFSADKEEALVEMARYYNTMMK